MGPAGASAPAVKTCATAVKTCAPAVKTCAPAVPRQLAGRWVERVETAAASCQQKNYLTIGTNLSFTFNLSATASYNRCDSQSYLDGYI